MIHDRLILVRVLGTVLLISYIGFIITLFLVNDLPKTAHGSAFIAGSASGIGIFFTRKWSERYQELYDHQVIYTDMRYQMIYDGIKNSHKILILSQYNHDYCLNGIPLKDTEIHTSREGYLGVTPPSDNRIHWYSIIYIHRVVQDNNFIQLGFLYPENYLPE